MRNKKSLRIWTLPLVLILALSLALPGMAAPALAQSVPPPPICYYGGLTFNGSDAPAGTEVTARMRGIEVGWLQPGPRVTIQPGKYGGPGMDDPALLVPGTEADIGATIEFYVKHPQASQAIKAEQTAQWHIGGGNELLNLSARDTVNPVALAGDDRQAWIDAPVEFDGSGSTDNCWVQGFAWDYGDGTTGSGPRPTHSYSEDGEFDVTLTVSDAAGNSASDTLKVTVAEAPPELDSIVINPASASLRPTQQQQFSATGYTSTGKAVTGVSFSWSVVGGGGTIDVSTGLFTAGGNVGTFTNTIQVTGTLSGVTKTGSATVVVTYPVTADFAASPASGAALLTVNFTDLSIGSPTSWLWEFGDGSQSNLQNPTHAYNAGGSYTVKLTATGAGGSSHSKTATNLIKVIQAEFSATPVTGTAPLTVAFTDTSKGDVTAWQWDFNNDGIVDSSVRNPSYSFSIAGNYSVKLRVSGPAGTSSLVKTGYIKVYQAPLADFTASVTTGTITGSSSVAASFADRSTGNPSFWEWDLNGDNVIDSTERNPVYTYTAGGNYTVSLTVTSAGGNNKKTKTQFISILQAGFTASAYTGRAPLTVSFTDTSKGTAAAWQWDFDSDGNVDSTAQNPSYTFPVGGNYTVSLRAIGPAGSSTQTAVIDVVEPPSAEFVASGSVRPAPFAVSFLDLSTGNPASWSWTFGDGATANTRNPGHTYTAGGNYTVSLTVTNADGTDTETKTNCIGVLDAVFSASATDVTAGTPVNFTESSAGPITGWYWSFGDGTGWFHARNTSHTYTTPGTYTVTLIVAGASASDIEKKVNYITVR